ncbi:MAG: Gldg family protein [Clostridiales bacterium]|jgi:ABC-2 type transport system permease protein|nr:Gldg family protein [Clostridiales bacterium]
MNAIFKKEFKNFFITPIGYVYLIFFQILASFFFVRTTNELSYADMSGSFFFFILIFVLLIPVLTMRLISEEKKNKTDQLLLTSPISTFEIVIGKYLATICLFTISVILTLAFPIIIMIFGKTSILLITSQYIGFFMLGMSFIAIGMYTSSLTENQIISAIISFASFLIIFFIEWVPINNTSLIKLVDAFSLIKHYENFNIGILSFSEFFYFLTIISIFFALTIKNLKSINNKKYSYVITIFTISLLIFFNIVVNYVCDKFDLKFDLSANKIYTISKETKDLLKKINKEILIYEVIADGRTSKEIENFIKKYTSCNNKIKYEIINLNDNLDFFKKYNDINQDNIKPGNLIIECNDKHKIISSNSFVSEEGIQIEQKLTSTIDSVFNNVENHVMFSVGHNESFNNYSIKEMLECENYTCTNIDLTVDNIDDEKKNILIVVDPELDFSESEIEKIKKFSDSGKNLIIFLSPFNKKLPNLTNYLKAWGIEPQDDFVIETDGKMYQMINNGVQLLLPDISYHETTSNLISSHIFLTRAKSLKFNEIENINTLTFFKTSEKSISKKNKENNVGSFNLGLLSTKKIKNNLEIQELKDVEENDEKFLESNMMTFGSPSILMDIGANIKFLINAVNFLSKKEDSILISAKIITPFTMEISKKNSDYIKTFLFLGIPSLFLLSGVLILKRRQRN